MAPQDNRSKYISNYENIERIMKEIIIQNKNLSQQEFNFIERKATLYMTEDEKLHSEFQYNNGILSKIEIHNGLCVLDCVYSTQILSRNQIVLKDDENKIINDDNYQIANERLELILSFII